MGKEGRTKEKHNGRTNRRQKQNNATNVGFFPYDALNRSLLHQREMRGKKNHIKIVLKLASSHPPKNGTEVPHEVAQK